MTQGTVKWFDSEKGYGFIKPNEGGSDVFVHISEVQKAGLNGLDDGQVVEYELTQSRNGKDAAANLQLVEANA